jgi:hypothetical protein
VLEGDGKIIYVQSKSRIFSKKILYLLAVLAVTSGSIIHKGTISLRFLGIILRVLRLEVSVYNVNITNEFQTTIAKGEGGKIRSRGDCE